MSKVDTIKYQGKDYATVPARLKEFREKNPRADVQTVPKFLDDGSLIFQATIVTDRSDEASARATGTARYTANEVSKPKAFEKLETISVGRALAMLGYLNNGEVATTEEMQEFEQYQHDKLETAIAAIKSATKRDEFQAVMAGLNAEQQKQITPIIKERMAELKRESEKEPQHAS